MLQVAQKRCEMVQPSLEAGTDAKSVTVAFHVFDAIEDKGPPIAATGVDGVISTLVLEHLPLTTFFGAVRKLLKKGGTLLLTNMHEEMGKRGQAGFVDVVTGEKIRGTSLVYSISEMLEEARVQGFVLIDNVKERGIQEGDVDVVGVRGKKWVGCKVWFGAIMRYEGV